MKSASHCAKEHHHPCSSKQRHAVSGCGDGGWPISCGPVSKSPADRDEALHACEMRARNTTDPKRPEQSRAEQQSAQDRARSAQMGGHCRVLKAWASERVDVLAHHLGHVGRLERLPIDHTQCANQTRPNRTEQRSAPLSAVVRHHVTTRCPCWKCSVIAACPPCHEDSPDPRTFSMSFGALLAW